MYAIDSSDRTPIHIALETGHIEVLKAFVDCGANFESVIANASDEIRQELIADYKYY